MYELAILHVAYLHELAERAGSIIVRHKVDYSFLSHLRYAKECPGLHLIAEKPIDLRLKSVELTAIIDELSDEVLTLHP